jgi:hypothetical protein
MNGNYSSSPKKESATGHPDRDPLATQDDPAKFLTQDRSAAEAAVVVEVEGLVQVDLDLGAVGLGDRHLIAVARDVVDIHPIAHESGITTLCRGPEGEQTADDLPDGKTARHLPTLGA